MVVLDNFDVVWSSKRTEAKGVLDKLAEVRNLALILTTKTSAPEGVEWTEEPPDVSKLSLEASRATFKDKYPLSLQDDSELDELLNELDFVPFTIRILASTGRSGKLTIKQLLEKWRSEHSQASVPLAVAAIEPLPAYGGAPPRSSHPGFHKSPSGASPSAVDQSVGLLLASASVTSHPDAIRVLSALVLLPNGAEASHLPEMFSSVKDINGAIDALSTANLVQKDDRNIYQVPAPIRTFVSGNVPADASILLDVGLFYDKMAFAWSQALSKGEALSIQAEVLQEQLNLEVTLRLQLSREKADEAAIQAAICYNDFQLYTAAKTDTIELALEAARKAEYTTLLAYCLQRFGDTCYTQTRYQEAERALTEARELLQKAGLAEAAAKCLFTIANIWRVQNYGRSKAKPMFTQALEEFRKVGSKAGEAQSMMKLGEVEYFLVETNEECEQVKVGLEEARRIFESIGDKRGIADCLRIIGRITSIGEKNFEEGRSTLEEALERYREIGDRTGEAQILQILGWALANGSEYQEAIGMFEQAKEVFEALDDRLGASLCTKDIERYRARS